MATMSDKYLSAGQSTMALWNQVRATDPKHTKSVSVRGGFTAIDPQYQKQEATKLWGPYGHRWGLSSLVWTLMEGNSFSMLRLDAVFFYPTEDSPVEFEITVDAKMKDNDDITKKLQTSAISKALSYLGFSADVFLGKFDDAAYVKDMTLKFGDQQKFIEQATGKINTARSDKDFAICVERIEMMAAKETISTETATLLMDVIDRRKNSLDMG